MTTSVKMKNIEEEALKHLAVSIIQELPEDQYPLYNKGLFAKVMQEAGKTLTLEFKATLKATSVATHTHTLRIAVPIPSTLWQVVKYWLNKKFGLGLTVNTTDFERVQQFEIAVLKLHGFPKDVVQDNIMFDYHVIIDEIGEV